MPRKFQVRGECEMTIGQSAVVEVEAENEATAIALVEEMNAFGGLNWREDWADQHSPSVFTITGSIPLHYEPWP